MSEKPMTLADRVRAMFNEAEAPQRDWYRRSSALAAEVEAMERDKMGAEYNDGCMRADLEASERRIAAIEAKVSGIVQATRPPADDFVLWLADRMVNIYGESEDMDFVQATRRLSRAIGAAREVKP